MLNIILRVVDHVQNWESRIQRKLLTRIDSKAEKASQQTNLLRTFKMLGAAWDAFRIAAIAAEASSTAN